MKIIYDFSVKKLSGQLHLMEEFKGKPLIIVNTASMCGFAGQFKEWQKLYEE